MKKSELKKLIKETLENVQEEKHEMIDEIGKFFIVKLPKPKQTIDDILLETDMTTILSGTQGDITTENTFGVYKQKSDARRKATELLKEFDEKLEELKSSMDDFRTSKKEIDEKKSKTKELILKLKPKTDDKIEQSN